MDALLDSLGEANTAALIGLLGGVVLGLAARIGRFCTLGAIEDALYGSDTRRLRMWGVAIGVAILIVHGAEGARLFDPAHSAYLNTVWNPAATVIGGLLFGYGMALSGNCGYGALARLGGGDLRSLMIVIVIGLSAYLVMSGPLAHARVWLFPVLDGAESPQAYSRLLNGPSWVFGMIFGGVVLLATLAPRSMRRATKHVFWGALVGVAVASGWIGTWWISQVGFGLEPIETHRFATPIGDTIFWGMTASGNAVSFSVGSVLGVVLGAALGSWSNGHFRWEACEDPRELKRQIAGAALMGPGAVLALGCSVGQGIAAFSVLAFSAPVAFVAIFVGAAIGLRQLIEGYSFGVKSG